MTKPDANAPLDCPNCGDPSEMTNTRYGRRDSCPRCGLHSWDGKPMVSQDVHDARKHVRDAFDPLWKTAETMYEIEEAEGSDERKIALARIRRTARNRAYRYVAFVTGMPESECHMSDQADIEKLRTIYRAAMNATAEIIRDWWKAEGEAWWEANKPKKAGKKEKAE